MEWSDLKFFLALVRNRTLSAAARELGQSQPTVGRRIKELERSVGHKLFILTPDGFALTDEGSRALAHAARAEEAANEFALAVTGQSNLLQGSIRISAFDWFGQSVLPPMLARYAEKYPSVAIEIMSENRVVSLARREADIAFRLVPFREPNVIQQKIKTDNYALYGLKALPKVKADASVRLITLNESYSDLPDMVWLEKTFPQGVKVITSNNRMIQAELAAEGVGYAVLPDSVAKKFKSLKRIETRSHPPNREIWMGYHRELAKLTRLREFIGMFQRI